MIKFEHTKKLIALLFLSYSLFLFGCDRAVGYVGKVVDENGLPVKGAKVVTQLNDQRHETVSYEDGKFIVIYGVGPWDFSRMTVNITADGFEPIQRSIGSNELDPHKDANENQIVLVRSLNTVP